MTKPLSSAAQAVLDAAFSAYWSAEQEAPNDAHVIAAAALRAVADQVVPEEQEPVPDVDSVIEMQVWACVSQRQRTRSRLLAIAAELKGGND
jgi:hypothetical protein